MMDDRLLIRVYGDSLICPREGSELKYYDLYQELLAEEVQNRFPDKKVYLTTRSRPDTSIVNIYNDAFLRDSFYFDKESTDITIIHCGICDCAPRPIPRRVRNIISRFPTKLRNACIHFLHSNRPRLLNAGYVWRLTKPELYLDILQEWINKAVTESRFVYIINIAPTIPEIETHSPGFGESILLYNSLIKKAVDQHGSNNLVLIDVYSSIQSEPNGIRTFLNQSDGHHLTKKGHEFYAQKIIDQSIIDLTRCSRIE